MQVSTAVITTTRVLLNQTEVEEALIAYLRSKTNVSDDAKFDFDLGTNAEDQFEAEIVIRDTSDVPFDPSFVDPKDETKPEPKRGRRSVKVSQPAPTPPAEAEKPAEIRNTFIVPEGHEAVRDEEGRATGDTKPIEEPKTEPGEVEESKAEETKPSATVTRIFPSPETSAPALAAAEPDPVTKAKSLFANLKPTS